MGGVSDVCGVSGIAAGRSMQRALAASALATIKKVPAERILKAHWPRDEQALLLLKSAQTPRLHDPRPGRGLPEPRTRERGAPAL
jgi:hypothetical protein